MIDDDYKIYAYHTLTPLEILDAKDWAINNFNYYDGEISPLWHNIVKNEFYRLSIEQDKWSEWCAMWPNIAHFVVSQHNKYNIEALFS